VDKKICIKIIKSTKLNFENEIILIKNKKKGYIGGIYTQGKNPSSALKKENSLWLIKLSVIIFHSFSIC
jgi:hypothetical protein